MGRGRVGRGEDPETETTTMWTIQNHETGEVAELVRDVATEHPEWVHRQLGSESGRESELQAILDQLSSDDYLGRGRDNCGVGYEAA